MYSNMACMVWSDGVLVSSIILANAISRSGCIAFSAISLRTGVSFANSIAEQYTTAAKDAGTVLDAIAASKCGLLPKMGRLGCIYA